MKKFLLYLFTLILFAFSAKAQTISLIGSCTPANSWGVDYDIVCAFALKAKRISVNK